eukprot:351704-Chlamydomonas_euryale.AAC.2
MVASPASPQQQHVLMLCGGQQWAREGNKGFVVLGGGGRTRRSSSSMRSCSQASGRQRAAASAGRLAATTSIDEGDFEAGSSGAHAATGLQHRQRATAASAAPRPTALRTHPATYLLHLCGRP